MACGLVLSYYEPISSYMDPFQIKFCDFHRKVHGPGPGPDLGPGPGPGPGRGTDLWYALNSTGGYVCMSRINYNFSCREIQICCSKTLARA